MPRGVILHRWPFQETGFIVEIFSDTLGKVRAVAKGAKRPKSPWRGVLEPFQVLDFDLTGRGELKTLTRAEISKNFKLSGTYLYSGFYLNELLQRLLPEQYVQETLFQDYLSTLQLLHEQVMLEVVLRKFEWCVLEHLDLDFSWQSDAETQEPIKPSGYYRFVPEVGFVEIMGATDANDFSGEEIQALAKFEFSDENQLRRYKQLMRWALQPYLGSKPLHSRNLFKPQN
ncbi:MULTISPECIES: DNA repair protein RecO [Gammaproteobacteria]|uniref:DNA repair protein RecO n=1 Tax=Gammaproteobacteria TaxID=1236 RepID=UPI000DCF8F20|nr:MULTISPECIES: DNA repair protein RecO [Gammaproteobacteria]RTE87110.1 DNA repair protein RecO [Aliidiomarina sp. B3213]TCZ93102.1 DNA repair protein RecO [Lysobacter sp. N42]